MSGWNVAPRHPEAPLAEEPWPDDLPYPPEPWLPGWADNLVCIAVAAAFTAAMVAALGFCSTPGAPS